MYVTRVTLLSCQKSDRYCTRTRLIWDEKRYLVSAVSEIESQTYYPKARSESASVNEASLKWIRTKFITLKFSVLDLSEKIQKVRHFLANSEFSLSILDLSKKIQKVRQFLANSEFSLSCDSAPSILQLQAVSITKNIYNYYLELTKYFHWFHWP